MTQAGSAGSALRFTGKRVLLAVLTVLGIALCTFILLQLAPGDAADVIAGEAGSATPEYLAQLKARYGPDQPLWVQFGNYLWQLLQFDLGYSFRDNQTVLALIVERLPVTLLLVVTAMAIAFGSGIALGMIAARFVNRWADGVISGFASLAYATPVFWVGLMLIALLSVHLGWLPSGGMETVGAGYTGLRRAVDIAAHLPMPAVSLALFYTALYTRRMRASMLDAFNQDYVSIARAKGLPEKRILRRHVVPNAMTPMITMLGLQVGALLGGSVLIETVFAWPGVGRLTFEALVQGDLNLLLGILLLCSLIVVVANLAVDLVQAWLDPRIELR
jgi:peptide/nickel transport system permease protein